MVHKCNICDRTNAKYLTFLPEQFFAGPYFPDDRYDDKEICQECQDIINETLYPEEDEDDGSYV